MRDIDPHRERGEKERSLEEFLTSYNEDLPAAFPRASAAHLRAFQKRHPDLFKRSGGAWSLERHRKKVMDWLPQHIKEHAVSAS